VSDHQEGSEVPREFHKPAQSRKKMQNPVEAKRKVKIPFSEQDAKALLETAEDIQNILPENVEEAWENWARDYDVSTHFGFYFHIELRTSNRKSNVLRKSGKSSGTNLFVQYI
jgi:hypothetical protein